MTLYLIGGLGADERVFKYLSLNCKVRVIKWIAPRYREALNEYVARLLPQIDTSEKFSLLGVSFGGLISLELAQLIAPEKVILISSVANSNQLPFRYRILGKLGLLNLLPTAMLKPPSFLLAYLFGAQNKELLKQIIRDTDPTFISWALNSLINWTYDQRPENIIRIHGSADRLIPLKGKCIELKGGGHFMIVDKAEELSELLNSELDMTNSRQLP